MRFLIIDEEAEDRRNIIKHLKKEFKDAEFIEVYSEKQFYDAIEKGCDFIITNFQLRWGNGVKVLIEAKKKNPFLPIIMLTDSGTEEVAVEAMKHGLDYYIIKTTEGIARLPAAVKAAMENEAKKKKEAMLISIVENAKEAVVCLDEKGNIIYVNKATEDLFKWKAEEIVGKSMTIFAVDEKKQKKQFEEAIKKGFARFETVRKDKDGNIIPVLMTVIPFKDKDGRLLFSSGLMVDIRDIKGYQQKIEHLNELLKAIRGINQLITMEKNEVRLLQKACKLLHDVKGYDGACISYKRKIYTSGEKKELQKLLKFFKEEIEKKVKEGKEVVYRFGNKYMIAMPFSKDKVRGSLCLVHSKNFSIEEIGLLKEVAGDISFALYNLKLEEKKKKAEEALKESEEKYRMLVETASEGICIDDTDEKIIFVNKAFAKLLGYKKKEIIGKKFIDFVYPEDKEKLKKEIKKRRKGKASRYELNVVAKDGRIKTFIISAVPLYENKKFVGSLSINLDITKLKETEKKFQSIFEGALDAIFIEDLNGNIVDVNTSACKLLGYSKDELLAMNVVDIVPEDIRKRMPEIINEELEKGGIRVESFNIHKGGKAIPVEVSTTLVEIGGKKRIIAIVRDITERKKMEQALKESEEKLRTLAESSASAIFIIQDDIFKYVNPAMEKMLGYSKDELSKMKFWQVVHPDDKKIVMERGKKRQRGEKVEPHHYEFRVITKDGRVRWVDLTASNIIYEGKPAALGNAYDITERKKAEEEIQKLSKLYYDIGMSINRSDTIKELCRKLLRKIKKIIEVDYANIFIYNKDKKILEPIVFYGYPKDFKKKTMKSYSLNDKKWEAVKVCLERKARYIKNLQKYKPLSFNWQLYKKYDVREIYTIPLITKEELYGVLQVLNTSKNPLMEEKRRLLRSIAEEIAAGVSKINAQEEMRRALEEESQFKLWTAHYFFNPIAIAKGYLEIAKEDHDIDKIEKALDAIERIEKVVKNVVTKGEVHE